MLNIISLAKQLRVLKNNLFSPALPIINKPKLIMTLLVKNEGDILEQNLIFHKAMGVDGFIVTDNNSSDNTPVIINQYHKKGWILESIKQTDDDYSQAKWVDNMVRIARDKYRTDWVINADNDEFWTAESGNLKDVLGSSSANKVFCPIYNVLPQNELNFYENNLLVQGKIDPDNYDLPKYNIFGVSIPKVAHRAVGYKMIHMGNHSVDMDKGKSLYTKQIIIYHYNIRNKEHFKKKMINGGKSISNNRSFDQSVGAHWRYFYNGYKDGTIDFDKEYDRYIGRDYWDSLIKQKIIVEGNIVKDFFNLPDGKK